MTVSPWYFGQVPQRLGVTAGAGVRYNVNALDVAANFANTNPQALQTYTITITAHDSTVYSFYVNDVEVTYTSDASATQAEIGAGLIADANSKSDVRSLFSFEYAAGVITATAVTYGTDIVIYDNDSYLVTAETTAPASASSIPFGRAIIDLQTYLGQSDASTCGLCVSDLLTEQVDTLTVTYAANEVYFVEIAVEGQTPLSVSVTATTDTATTHAAIVAAINAIMPASTVVAAGTSPDITLTAEKPGLSFVTSIGLKSGTASRLTLAHTVATPFTAIEKVFGGVALSNYTQPGTAVGSAASSYAANDTIAALKRGQVWVASSETVTPSDEVWVETASGDDSGKFFTSSSATRLQLSGVSWIPKPTWATGQSVNILSLA